MDKADHDPRWATLLNYTPKAGSPPLHNEICAIREAFEESGVLLSDPPTELSNEEIKVWREKVCWSCLHHPLCGQWNLFQLDPK